VLVVGAGPAGLKAAQAAVLRGHRVTIVDDGPRPGGRLRAAEKTAALGLVSAVDYLVAELAELGVKVRSRTTADEALLCGLAPDHVVLATGGRPVTTTAYPAAADGVVISSTDALAGTEGGLVLVFDAVGANEGPLVAEALAGRGAAVVYVTSCEIVMPWGGQLHRYEVPAILRRRCEQVITDGLLGDIDGKHVIVVRPDGETITELDADTIVPIVAPRPALELVEVLDRLSLPHMIVGDALAPRTAMHAFKEGYDAGLVL
jgi:hypothetical protein